MFFFIFYLAFWRKPVADKCKYSQALQLPTVQKYAWG